jgi:DUF3072 family protein
MTVLESGRSDQNSIRMADRIRDDLSELEPMTGAPASYLKTLSEEAGEKTVVKAGYGDKGDQKRK